YDAFRLQVSSSYREVFDRELRNVLERYGWQIVRFLPRRRTRGPSGVQLATGSLLPRLVQHAPARPIHPADVEQEPAGPAVKFVSLYSKPLDRGAQRRGRQVVAARHRQRCKWPER